MRLGPERLTPARTLFFCCSTVDAAVHIRRKFELPIFRDEGPGGGGHARRRHMHAPLYTSSVNLHLKYLNQWFSIQIKHDSAVGG